MSEAPSGKAPNENPTPSLTRAPKPPTPVRGGSSYNPPPISIPFSFPEGWPWDKTTGLLREAVKGLNQAQVEAACEKVVLGLKAIQIEVVKAGQIMPQQGAERMLKLLRELLENNRKWDAGGYEILEKLRLTKTWIEFEQELVSCETSAQTEAAMVKDAIPIEATDLNQLDVGGQWPRTDVTEADGSLRSGPAEKNLPRQSERLRKGSLYVKVTEQAVKTKTLHNAGRSVAQIQNENPNWEIWSYADREADQEQREIFNHPNQWGGPVGYALNMIRRVDGKPRVQTMKKYMKMYRSSQRRA